MRLWRAVHGIDVRALAPREHDVLDLMAQGLDNAQIAERLFIGPKTVSNHITHIFSKLQVDRQVEAVVQARKIGFGHNGTSQRIVWHARLA